MTKEKDALRKIQEGITETSKQIQDGFTDLSHDFWLASLGVIATVEEETTNLYNKFVAKGKDLVEKGKAFEKKDKEKGLSSKVSGMAKFVDEKVLAAMEPFKTSSQKDIKELNAKIDKLTESVAALTLKLSGKSASKF